MTKHPENKDKGEQKVSKDELSEQELEKASGGLHVTKSIDHASPKLLLNSASGQSHK